MISEAFGSKINRDGLPSLAENFRLKEFAGKLSQNKHLEKRIGKWKTLEKRVWYRCPPSLVILQTARDVKLFIIYAS